MTDSDDALTRDVYGLVFYREKQVRYAEVHAFERKTGFMVDRERLEAAARVLACPVKKNPPNWQHGRVIYSELSRYLANMVSEDAVICLDIGTAKGFSALCMRWAMDDSDRSGAVYSVDVIDPEARVRRNTVAEVGGYRTLRETMSAWPEAAKIRFSQSTGESWLRARAKRVHFAFVDGKHSEAVVAEELRLLSALQRLGDVAICDDLQVPGVEAAVDRARHYSVTKLSALANRRYAIMTRN